MKQENLRDTRKQDDEIQDSSPTCELPSLPIEKPQPIFLYDPPSYIRIQRSVNFMDFLMSMNRLCYDRYDPRYEHVTLEDLKVLDKSYGRHISLEEGLQQPELVSPRTKLRYTIERIFTQEDITHYWYRTFVICADFANLIPQFRELSIKDQCDMFKLNFFTFSWCINLEQIVLNPEIRGYPMGNGSFAPWRSDDIAEFLKKYNFTPATVYKPHQKAMEDYNDFIHKNMIIPIQELNLNEKEICLLKVMTLFQNEEHFIGNGKEICHNTTNFILDTLWDYQLAEYPAMTFDEKLRRHSRFLLLLPKICQAWYMKSDMHLLMSMFGGTNIDGIPKELLFSSNTNA